MNQRYRGSYNTKKLAPTIMKPIEIWGASAQVLLAISLLVFGGRPSKALSFDISLANQQAQLEKGTPAPLEVRITAPPRWEKGCLLVTLERTNRSSVPLFLTDMGPYFYMALDVSTGEVNAGEAIAWVNIYGISDIRSVEAFPLAPSATVHNEFCFSPAIWVVNLKKETRREIPVRGKLRIDVSFFSTEEYWKRNKEWYINPPAYLNRENESNDPPANIAPKWARIFAAIPCSDATCKFGCVGPPRGLPGEDRPVPDVYSIVPEWNNRGQLLTDELTRKSSSHCSENNRD